MARFHVVTALQEVLDPRAGPAVAVLVDPRRVRVISGEQTRPRGRTRRCRDVTVGERDSLLDQSVEVQRVHVVRTERGDGVEPLLSMVVKTTFGRSGI